MRKILTLAIIHKGDKVLLGMKKRGFGMGRWNGFGGKVEGGETIKEAAKREILEEAGITVTKLFAAGVVEFEFKGNQETLEVHIFRASEFEGEPQETEEMRPQWFDISEIPFSEMWADDAHWFPLFLAGKKFQGRFVFDGLDTIKSKELTVV
ncbi:MAG: 8-oxo-dGTP diphosphatase [Candidatus Spechtbacteria bacterium]|nr:8-oxo-dGTP diphosphatase [Candidatus Spechtbacteria bacterium]